MLINSHFSDFDPLGASEPTPDPIFALSGVYIEMLAYLYLKTAIIAGVKPLVLLIYGF